MNKLIALPLTFLFLIAVFSIYTANDTGNYTGGYNEIEDNPGTHETFGIYWSWPWEDTADGQQQTSFVFWTVGGMLLILSAAIALGTVSGVSVLGSGLSDFSQRLIFTGCIYCGIWSILSAASNHVLNVGGNTFYGTVLWIALSFMFVIGVSREVNGVD